jgi:hypothetical protein
MARVSNYALPEHWTKLNAARQQLSLLGDDVEAIKRACEETCGKKHVLQCTDCYPKVLNRMFARYRDHKEGEWFSQRSAFIFSLETLFSKAKDRELDLGEIEADIESEKEAWYRWVLRRHTEFLAVSDGADQDEVRSILDDPDRSREALVSMVWEAVGKPDNWSSRVDAFSEKVAAAGDDSAALKKIYVDEFFKDATTGEVPEEARPYLEQYEASPETRLEDIVDQIVHANRDGKSSQAQRDTHQRRLDELRRAKTAFEQNRVRNKGLHNGSAAPAVSEKLYSLPNCSICEKGVDPKDVLSCALCQAASHLRGEGPLQVYCSETCNQKGQVRTTNPRLCTHFASRSEN